MERANEESMEEIVHIIPLGYEIDTAVRPFDELKANRVHLLAVTETFGKHSEEMIERQKYYLNIVKEKLEEKGIQVQIVNIDLSNLLQVMEKVAEIIREERAWNNMVYVNISASGRFNSAGPTIAAMYEGARVYYVLTDRYSKNREEMRKHGISICKNLRLRYLKNFMMYLPDDPSEKTLIATYLLQQETKKVTKTGKETR